jgi:hypothetical protein
MKTKPQNTETKKIKLTNPFKTDPFFRVTASWAAGLVAVIMVMTFAATQMDNSDQRVIDAIPFIVVLFGCVYLVKFIGKTPSFYSGLCGVMVGFGLALMGLVGELFQGFYWESFSRFLYVGFLRALPLLLIGMLSGWWVTRGRVAIEIEMPGKKEIEAAHKEGRPEPTPRIITPVSAMPGSKSANSALLEQLDKDPVSLLSEKEKKSRLKE